MPTQIIICYSYSKVTAYEDKPKGPGAASPSSCYPSPNYRRQGNSPDFKDIDVKDGLVKYELVALKDDEKTVVASGKTAKEMWVKAQKRGFIKPILSRMPAKLIPYVGFGMHEGLPIKGIELFKKIADGDVVEVTF